MLHSIDLLPESPQIFIEARDPWSRQNGVNTPVINEALPIDLKNSIRDWCSQAVWYLRAECPRTMFQKRHNIKSWLIANKLATATQADLLTTAMAVEAAKTGVNGEYAGVMLFTGDTTISECDDRYRHRERELFECECRLQHDCDSHWADQIFFSDIHETPEEKVDNHDWIQVRCTTAYRVMAEYRKHVISADYLPTAIDANLTIAK